MASKIPSEPPPPYSAGDSSSSSAPTGAPSSSSSFLHPNRARNGIPPAARRSMEDEGRPLPDGWVRQYDGSHGHQFFVDTRANPPRSIWHHPYDDREYLNSLTSEERERIQELHKVPTPADIVAESSDEDDHNHHYPSAGKTGAGANFPSSAGQQPEHISGVHKFGRKMKDKVTSSTHEQREAERKARAEQERRAYQQHLQYRQALQQAMQTGQPQLLGKDKEGRDVYIEPPGGMQGGYSSNGRMINPYAQGPYQNPNARFITPQMPYQRPYGYGYGGGYGLPLYGGLAGGLLLGGLMF